MSEWIEKACAQVGEYNDEMMLTEFDQFFKAQPALCDFVVELTNESSQQIQDITLFLSYMIFKAVEAARAAGVDAVTPKAIEAAYHDSELWIDQMSQAEGTDLDTTIASNLEQDTEPFLLQYVIAELNQAPEYGSELNDEEKGAVFFVLKTVMSSLSESNRRIIETQ